MNPIKVSVVVPVFNKERYVVACLKSIANQEFSDWECIIVDDGSTDLSMHYVKEFIKGARGNWQIISQRNLGPSAARNSGMRIAKGKYIAFLDADDLWLETKLSRQVSFMEKNPNIALTLTNYIIFSNNDYRVRMRGVRARKPLKQISRWLDMRGFGGLIESTGLLRRDEFSLEFDESMKTTEGLDFVIKCGLIGEIYILQDFLTLYRISNNQLHTQEELVNANANQLAFKYPFLIKNKANVIKLQQAYFELSKMRKWKKLKVLKYMIFSILPLNVPLFHMAVSVLFRNLFSIVLPIPTKLKALKIIART